MHRPDTRYPNQNALHLTIIDDRKLILQIQYTLKRCSNKECCKQCRYVNFKGTITKWPVHKLTHRTTQKHVQHHDATD